MEKDFLNIKEAKKVDTKDTQGNPNGFLLELVSERDGFTDHIKGQMYMTVAEPGTIKGYHLHAQADYYVICVKGKLKYTAYKDQHTKQEVIMGDDNFKLLHLPKGHPHALEAIGDQPAYVIMYRYPAWDETTYKTDQDEQLDIAPEHIETQQAWQDIQAFTKKFS